MSPVILNSTYPSKQTLTTTLISLLHWGAGLDGCTGSWLTQAKWLYETGCLACVNMRSLLFIYLIFLFIDWWYSINHFLFPSTTSCFHLLCRYLNDVFTLEVLEGTSLQWECPNIEGPSPSPRESHTSITLGNKLLVYGGMNGKRLGDVWILDVGKG